MKVARTVLSGGKDGDNFKVLPIATRERGMDMERYKEISLADFCELIIKEEFEDVYVKGRNGELYKADERQWNLGGLAKNKWFKREVIE